MSETPAAAMLRFHRRFLPFEKAVLSAVCQAFPEPTAVRMARQVACINKVQRLLEWNEVEFYCMKGFKVAWPDTLMFPTRDEIEMARATLESASLRIGISVFAVGGHVFSIESDQPLRPFRNVVDPRVTGLEILRDPMVARS